MTAILAFNGNGYPFVVGDLLLSNAYESNNSNVPTVGDTSEESIGGPSHIVGLRQKVNIVSPNLVVAWSGDFSCAEELICDLRSRFRRSTLSNTELKKYLDVFAKKFNGKLSIVGAVSNSDGVNSFGMNSLHSLDENYGKLVHDGTGDDELLKFLRRSKSIPRLSSQVATRPNHIEAMLFALSMCGASIQSEIVTRKSLLNRYGGGWEIATLIPGGFTKIDDVLYLIYFITKKDTGEIDIQPHSMHLYKYYNIYDYEKRKDVLCIHSYRIRKADRRKKTAIVIDKSIHWVTPLYRDILPAELERERPPVVDEARFICNIILVQNESRSPKAIIKPEFLHKRTVPIRVVETQGRTEWQFDEEYIRSLVKMVNGTR